MEIENLIRKYILINAIEHEGTAQTKSVLGKLLADEPELRSDVLKIKSLIDEGIEEINELGIKKQKEELEKLGGYRAPEKIEKKKLPDLEVEGKFVVRFAPNPDGALHLGNARPAIISFEYAKKYNGKFILRFDDTDPKIKIPEKRFYKWIKEDLKWLKIKINQEVISSKRLKIYYKYAENLIKKDKAYVCTCGEEWKKLRDVKKPCPCRDADPRSQLKKWKKMINHDYKEGEAVLRIKTDLSFKNPAVRDWAAFRIVDNPIHPMEKKKHVWPLYNFASAVDDHLLNVTHIFRGQEHSTNEMKQIFLYEHFGWEYPEVIIMGRFSLSDMVLSKSEIREGIRNGIYNDWDDLRLGTLRSFRKRGYRPEAIKQIILYIGPKSSDVTIASENLAAYNRRIVDKIANRYFFVPNPKKIEIKGLKTKKIKISLHPEQKKGYRTLVLGKTFFVDTKDFEKYKGLEIRLKDLCNIKLNGVSEFTSKEPKPLPKIQWVPAKSITVRISMPSGEIKGYGETDLAKTKVNDIVQLERFGFVRINKITKENVFAIFAHE